MEINCIIIIRHVTEALSKQFYTYFSYIWGFPPPPLSLLSTITVLGSGISEKVTHSMKVEILRSCQRDIFCVHTQIYILVNIPKVKAQKQIQFAKRDQKNWQLKNVTQKESTNKF